jgi:hypothetical protein
MRQRLRPVTNPRLHEAIGRVGWSLADTAAAINQVGLENGLGLTYGAGSVAHWLTGTMPRAEVIPIVVEAFTRGLGIPTLTASDLGWPQLPTLAGPEGLDDPWSGDPVAWITHLGRDDMLDRRTALTAGIYAISAALPARPHPTIVRHGPARRAGASDITRIRAMGDLFQEMDDQYGGGHARSLVAAYLTQHVAPLLCGTTGRARPGLFIAAAELAYLLGWMAADDLRTGLAQRYYIQAVRLAEEADDRTMRSTALRSLSVQAIELGHAKEGLALAEAAAEGLRRGASARKRAWITGMRAEALAATGYGSHQARDLLRKAEADLEHADSPPEGEWTGNYRRESFEHQVGLTLAQMGDHKAAEEHFAASVASRRLVERRTKALIGARLAEAQLQQLHPEAAAHTVLGLAADLDGVSSERIRQTLIGIRRAWQPYRPDPFVDQADRFLAETIRSATHAGLLP